MDFKISRGSLDSTLVEFKFAKNTSLRKNLENQVEIYKKANKTTQSYKVTLYFSDTEYNRIVKVVNNIKDLKNMEDAGIILIDARNDKPSASKADKH